MIKSKNASWIHNITKTPTLEENTDYDKLMREYVKVKNNKLLLIILKNKTFSLK